MVLPRYSHFRKNGFFFGFNVQISVASSIRLFRSLSFGLWHLEVIASSVSRTVSVGAEQRALLVFVSPALKSLKWIPVKSHLYLRDAVMAFKCMTGLSPNYLSNKFISRSSISGRATRNSQKLNIPLCKSATGQRSFYYRIVSIWNTINPTLKLSQCVSSFKRNLKLDLLKEFLS